MTPLAPVADPDAPDETAEPEERQLRFDGMPVRQHDIAFTGLVPIDTADVKGYKAGQTVKFLVTGHIVARVHRFQKDKDSGDRYVKHQLTVQINWADAAPAE